MKVEIVDFYKDFEVSNEQKGILCGTMHAFLIDLSIDLRGITVFKKRDYWRFAVAYRKGIDEGKDVWYPTFSFCNPSKQKDLMDSIYDAGRKYIEECVKINKCKAC